ncbi:MAG: FGGY-family carbohydrate kinase [Myxococcota bacterium]
MSAELLLSIDLGTTRLKVAAFGPDGRLLALVTRRHREYRDASRSWQSAEEWWDDTVELVRRALADPQVAGRRLLGLSLCGRGGAAVFVDDGGTVIEQPWSDGRHRDELRRVFEWRSDGVRIPSYAAALVAKALWLRERAPERFRRVRHALYAKDFLLYRLTGVTMTDWSSGPDAPEWDERLFARSKLEPSLVPTPALPWELAGTLTRRAAEELGCPARTPVAVGAHDGICANVGAAAGLPGAYAITLGTHAVVRAITCRVPEGAFRFYGLPPDRHVIGGNALLAGRALEWLLDHWFDSSSDGRAEPFARLDAEAARVAPGADGVRFLPFLGGQVAPHRRPDATAAFAGLRLEHGRPQLWRAALEGTAFAIRDIFQQVRAWCGLPRVIRLTGGGERSEAWTQILADVLDERLESTGPAAESRGAAVFLAVALGLHADVDDAARAMTRVANVREPDPERAAVYAEIGRAWEELAEATRSPDPG